jgi:hypothetical protein
MQGLAEANQVCEREGCDDAEGVAEEKPHIEPDPELFLGSPDKSGIILGGRKALHLRAKR